MLAYIGGIPGVGKTTIINDLIDELNLLGHKSELIKGLPILCELAGNLSPDEFRALPDIVRNQYRSAMYQKIFASDLQDFSTIRISDGHFIFFEASTKLYSKRKIQSQEYEQLKFIGVIEANPNIILERRKNDIAYRYDRSLDLERIKEQLEIEREEGIIQAEELGVPFVVIENNADIDSVKDSLLKNLLDNLKLDKN